MTRRLRRGAIFARAIHACFREFNRTLRVANPPLHERAEWLTESSRRVLRSLEIGVAAQGTMPERGLLVSNHLSYIDIICYSSLAPCVFVSKSDVRSWPVFGRLATNGGTIYVDRNSRADAARAAREIEQALRSGVRVVLFPEGTSSSGENVLPFHAPLLEGAIRAESQITPACIGYDIEGGDVSQDVCYWGDMTFSTHFLGLLGRGKVHANIVVGGPRIGMTDRKSAMKVLYEDVVELHHQLRSAEGEHRVESSERERIR